MNERALSNSIPERFAGAEVIGAIRVADGPSEHPYRTIILTIGRDGKFNTHRIAWNGTEWVGGNGHYDLSWTRALDDLSAKAKDFPAPEPNEVK